MFAVFHKHVLSKRVLSSGLVLIVSPLCICILWKERTVLKEAWLLPGLRMGMVFSRNPYSMKGVKLL